jgi:hypothetical protein
MLISTHHISLTVDAHGDPLADVFFWILKKSNARAGLLRYL